MNYRSLLVLLDDSESCAARIDMAIGQARDRDCHLVGLAPTGLVEMGASSQPVPALEEFAARAWDHLRDRASQAANRFRDECRVAGLKSYEAVVDEDDKAISLVQSNSVVRGFRLDEETQPLRERYGMTRFGQSCLLARRLVEAGTRFVQVTWPARSDDEPVAGPDGSWDTHRNNFPMLRDHRCPVFDRTLSALIEDLDVRGLLDSTLVVAIGEFGRSPKIGASTTDNVGPGGRDHWPECYSFLIAGGGVRPGQVYGESDRFGGWPKTNAVHPYDVLATVHHALGIDPTTEYRDTLNRPRRLVEHGRPIVGLF